LRQWVAIGQGAQVSTSSSKRRQFWRADWFIGAVIVAAVFILWKSTGLFETLERRFYDVASIQSSRQPSDRIAVIAIDDQSIANIGRWPWPRDVHADLIDKLGAAKAKTIVYTTFFFEPQTDRGLAYIRKIKEALGAGAEGEVLARLMAEAEQTLDTDGKLAASMAKAGNVLVPSVFELGEPQGKPDKDLPVAVAKSTVDDRNSFALPAVRGQYPIDGIGNAAAGVGHLNQTNDVDGAVRADPLLVNYYGRGVPSMALLAAAKSLNLGSADIKVNAGEGVQVGKLKVRTDDAARILPQFYRARDGRPPFAGRLVLRRAHRQDPGQQVRRQDRPDRRHGGRRRHHLPRAPGYAALSPAEMMAHVTSSILAEHFIVEPSWGSMAAFGAFLLVAAYLIGLLPRLSAGWAPAPPAPSCWCCCWRNTCCCPVPRPGCGSSCRRPCWSSATPPSPPSATWSPKPAR
jgi:hypothetical protein